MGNSHTCLCGVYLRWTKNITEKRWSSPFIGLSQDDIIGFLLAHISRIRTGSKDPVYRVSFTSSIDYTSLVKSYQVSTSDNAIVGGAYPNDFISVDDLTNE